MRVLIVATNTARLNMPTMPLGAAHVYEAARSAGHDVRFIDMMHHDDLPAAVAAWNPRVIGLSVRNIDDQEMDDPTMLVEQVKPVVAACRSTSAAPLVLGGPGYSIFPTRVLDLLGADYGIAGDGEEPFVALLDALERGSDPAGLPGLHVAGGPRAAPPPASSHTQRWPLPRPELWSYVDPETPDLWVPVQTRRGCPNDCSYCSTWMIQGRRIRSLPPDVAARGMADMARAGFRRFYIVDNSFNIPRPYALELCRLLSRLDEPITWRAILYPQNVDEELVDAMHEAGCVEVALGFESGSPRILRAMNKRYTPRDVRSVSDMLDAHGIRRMGFLLLGGPGETRETVEESLAFARSLRLDMLRITVGIRIYPGTPLARTAVQEGIVAPDDDLFEPRFYLAPGLAPWIHERVTPGVTRPGLR
jgi:radical SAM superfamily enzyme YgiQ (UPF0313 family)